MEMIELFGFADELRSKDCLDLIDKFVTLFSVLPLAAVIENKVFVCHGGLISYPRDEEYIVSLQEISSIKRGCKNPYDRAESDPTHQLLWNDPIPDSNNLHTDQRVKRGIPFSVQVTKSFLAFNGLQLIVRSHQFKDKGYELIHEGKVITVFSAPNYCGDGLNQGAIVEFTDSVTMTPNIKQIDAKHYPMEVCAFELFALLAKLEACQIKVKEEQCKKKKKETNSRLLMIIPQQ